MPKQKQQKQQKKYRPRRSPSSSSSSDNDQKGTTATSSAPSSSLHHLLIQDRKEISVVHQNSSSAPASLRIATWNLLTQASIEEVCGHYVPSFALQWKHRFKLIKEQIIQLKADVLCLQEVPTSDGIIDDVVSFLETPSILFSSSHQVDGDDDEQEHETASTPKNYKYKVVYSTNPFQRQRKDAVLIAWKVGVVDLVGINEEEKSSSTSSPPKNPLIVPHLIPGGKVSISTPQENKPIIMDNNKNNNISSSSLVVSPSTSTSSTANSGIAVLLKMLNNGGDKVSASSFNFIVATTHLSGAKLAEEVRIAEMKKFLKAIRENFSSFSSPSSSAMILAADLNTHPKMKLCQEVLKKEFDFENVYVQNNADDDSSLSGFVDKEFTCYMQHYQDVCDFIMYNNNIQQQQPCNGNQHIRLSSVLQVPSVTDVIRQRYLDAAAFKLEKQMLFPVFEGLPTISFPSDHLPLCAEFEIC